jgi:hypothetical protein
MIVFGQKHQKPEVFISLKNMSDRQIIITIIKSKINEKTIQYLTRFSMFQKYFNGAILGKKEK